MNKVMTKQEFLAASLPYGLKIIHDDNEVETISALGDSFQYQISGRRFNYGWYGETFDCTPILHPLSDLTKPIEHKGEKFVPIEWFEMGDADNDSIEYDHGNIKLIKALETISIHNVMHDIAYLPFAVVLKLVEWHFDLFGGIESGEAIDVNTLDINPYK